MANDAASIIVIDDKVLRQFDDYDKKLERMKQSTADAVKAVNSSFASLGASGGGIDTTIGALDKLIAKLGEVGEAGKSLADVGANASSAASGFENAGNSAANAANAARGATNGLQGAAEMLDEIEKKLSRPFKQVSIPDLRKLKEGLMANIRGMEGQPMDAANTKKERDSMNMIRLIEQEISIRRAGDKEELAASIKVLNQQRSKENILIEAKKKQHAEQNAINAAKAKEANWTQKANQSLNKAASANPDGRNTELTDKARALEDALEHFKEVRDNGVGDMGIKNFNQAIKNAEDNIRNMKNALDEALGETQLQKNAPKKSYKELMGSESDVIDSGHIGRIKEEIKDIEKLLNYSGSNLTQSETQALIDLEARYRRSVEELRKTTDEKNGIVENASKKTREAYARLGGNLANYDIEGGQRDLLSAIGGKNSATNRLRGVLNSNRAALMQDGAGSPVESGYQDLVKLLDEARQREKELENTKGMPVDEWLDKLREYKDFLKQVDDAAQTLQGRVMNSSTLSGKQADGIRGALSTARMMANKNMGEVGWADKNLSAASKSQAMVEAQIKRISDLKKRLEDLSVAYEELKTAQKDRNADGSLTDEAKALIDEKDKVQARYDQELKSIEQVAAEESKRRAKEEAEAAAQAERDAKAAENEATRSENAKNKAITAELRYQDELRKTQEIINAGNRQLETVGTDSKYGGDKLDSEIQELITRKQDLDDAIARMQDAVANGADSKEVNRYTEEVRQATRAVQNQERAVVSARRESQRLYNEANDPAKITADRALNNSNKAKSIRERVEALRQLKEAYNNLDPETNNENEVQARRNVIREIDRQTDALRRVGIAANGARLEQNKLWDVAGQMARQLALVFSVSQVTSYVREMVNVRAQFELAERSLSALLQSSQKAGEIFNKIKALSIKSPFTAMELTDYTKQLASYRVESDKLYDTTKRLADISAGLGVDMNRLILAYGQVKAAAYLRGTEVRQFTEAGVNVYGELQRYFEEVKGEAYTTSQIVDMISQKKVTFEDLDAVIQRMTNSGGMFYNMQSIQADTLAGKLGNLKDAIDLMFDSMGQSSSGILNGVLDGTIGLVKNWEKVRNAVLAVVAVLGLLKLQATSSGLAMSAVFKQNVGTFRLSASISGIATAFKSAGAAALTFGRNVMAALASNGILLAVTAIIAVLTEFFLKNKEYKEQIKEIEKANGDMMRSLTQAKEAFDNAGSDGGNMFEEQKKQLYALKNELDSKGFKVKIDIENITPEEADKAFAQLEDAYRRFMKAKKSIEEAFAENNKRWEAYGMLGNNIDTDAADVMEAYDDVISKTGEVDDAITSLYSVYNLLSEAQKRQLDEAQTQKDGEDEISFLERKAAAVGDITNAIRTQSNATKEGKEIAENANKAWIDFTSAAQWSGFVDTSLRGQLEEFDKELDDLIKHTKAKYTKADWDKNKDVYIKAALDTTAADKGWSEWLINHANQHIFNSFHIKIDKEEEKRQLEDLETQIKKAVEGKIYTVNLRADTGALEGSITSALNKMKQELDNLKSDYEAVERAKPDAYGNYVVDKADYNSVMGTTDEQMRWQNRKLKNSRVTRAQYIEYAKKKYKSEYQNYIDHGGKPEDDGSSKSTKNKNGGGAERDIWLDRIQVLKDMSAKYYELRQTIGEKAALEEIKSGYKSTLELLKMPQNVLDKFYDKNMKKAGLYEAIEMSIPSIKKAEDRGKERQAQAVLKVEVKKEQVDDAVEQAGIWAQEAAGKLDIYTKFHDMGMSDQQIESMFGKLPASISEQITEYEEKWKKAFTTIDKEGKEIVDTSYMDKNTEQGKKYYDGLKSLQDANAKHFVELAADVVKAYRDQLSEQVKLDLEYAQQRAKIFEKDASGNYILNDWQREEAVKNLDKSTNEKRNKLSLDEFQNSDTYLEIFQNLDRASEATLERLENRLNAIKDSLKELDPTSLKTIMDIQNKIGEQRMSLQPFREYIRLLREAKALAGSGRTESFLNDLIMGNDAAIQGAQSKINEINTKLSRNAYMNFVKTSEGQSGQPLTPEMQQAKAEAEALQNQKKQQEEVIKNAKTSNTEAQKGLKTYSDKRAAAQKSADAVGQVLEQTEKLHTAMSGLFDALGASDSTAAIFSDMAMSLAQSVLQTIMLQLQLDAAAVAATGFAAAMNSAAGILGWILLAVQAITSIFTAFANNKDKKITKKVERLKREVEDLSESFEQLEKNIDSAFTLDALNSFTEQSIQNLEEQNRKQQEIIDAEKQRKKANQDTIRDAEKTIRDNDRQIEELKNVRRQQNLGGWGSDENYKSQAQSFVDAWLDAYAEVGDSMKALKDTWNDVLKNIMKKTIMYKVASKIIDQFLKPIDSALEQYAKDGDFDKLADSINQSTESFEQNLPALNNLFKNMADKLNLNSITDNLSSLQQGIQGVTEDTAEALEGMLNSIRNYVSLQRNDVAAIRKILEAHYGSSAATSNPKNPATLPSDDVQINNQMLAELKTQTDYLRRMDSKFTDIFTSTQSKGFGIRVFVQ